MWLSATAPVHRLYQDRRARVLLVGATLFLAAAAFPGASGCLFLRISGLPCPACGAIRATLAMIMGHPLQALAWNPGLWFGAATYGACRWGASLPHARGLRLSWRIGLALGLSRILMVIAQVPQPFFITAF